MGKLFEKLLAEMERDRVKRRLKRAFARKPKPARVRIPDEGTDTKPAILATPPGDEIKRS